MLVSGISITNENRADYNPADNNDYNKKIIIGQLLTLDPFTNETINPFFIRAYSY
jgi:hypothetical protein